MSTCPKVAMIGGGNMANALASGLLAQGCPPAHLMVIEIDESLRQKWQARGVKTLVSADATLSGFDVWMFAVKPQQMREVVQTTGAYLRQETLVISIAAGISITSLSTWLANEGVPHHRVVRCMPNTPALVAAGVTGMAAPKQLSEHDRNTATHLLSSVGQVVWVDGDASIDAVTALSGSGPAYVFLFIEALIAGGQKLGLSHDQSRTLALATLAGATKLAAESPENPGTLRERVTSKGGTTAAALDVFVKRDFSSIVQEAMAAADHRAAELSREFGSS